MKQLIRISTLVCSIIGFVVLPPEQKASAFGGLEKRPVTVADAIGMRTLADRRYLQGADVQNGIAQSSPDGKKVVIVVKNGNLASNTNDYSLLLWGTDKSSAPPAGVLTLSSSSNRAAIKDVTWLADNETVAFLGEHPGELQQLYMFDTRTRILRRITNHPLNLFAFSITPDGHSFAFVSEGPVKSIWDNKTVHSGLVVKPNQLINSIVIGLNSSSGDRANPELYWQHLGKRAERITTKGILTEWGNNLHVAPNGRYLLVSSRAPDIPEAWKDYSDTFIHTWATRTLWPGEASWVLQFELIDTNTHNSSKLMNSPCRWDARALWAPNSRSVALSGVYLPLDNIAGEARELRKSTAFSVEVHIPSRDMTEISHKDIKITNWMAGNSVLAFKADPSNMGEKPSSTLLFRKSAGAWREVHDVPGDQFENMGPDLVLEEDMNTSPKLFTISRSTHTKTLLLDLNPQFDKLRFGKEEEIHWKTSDGQEFTAGLYYPADYLAGQRYPLVIQTHGFNPNRFWIDGPWTTGFAAQALAGKGIMVLQVEDNDGPYASSSPEAVDRAVGRFETAIDYLDGRGFIDRNRVGLVGFSRTCLDVKYALSHSSYKFAAASVADGIDGGYFQYLLKSGASAYGQVYDAINGGMPWGAGLASWSRRSPGFNMDKVHTPLRITAENPDVALFEWEWYAALGRLRKPVEMIVMKDGEHILQKPWERMVSQQGNVDWFVFWLKGEEATNPSTAEQYARWRKLRDQLELKPN